MSEIQSFIRSFLRLQHDIARFIKLTPLQGKTSPPKYRLTLYPGSPLDNFLPLRIAETIAELTIKLKPSSENEQITLLLGNYPNCTSLTVEAAQPLARVDIAGAGYLRYLHTMEAHIDTITIDNLDHVEYLYCTMDQLLQWNYERLRHLHQLELQFSSNITPLDLNQFPQLTDLKINGRLKDTDKAQLQRLVFSSSLSTIHFHFLLVDNLDLSSLHWIRELVATQIRAPTQEHHPQDVKIIWPNSDIGPSLSRIRLNKITLKDDPVIFDGKRFPHLEYLEFDNHMNHLIYLVDLPELHTFRTSMLRYIVGHQVQIFMINCTNMSAIRTSPRIQKFLWNTSLPTEFSQNSRQLDKRPDIPSN